MGCSDAPTRYWVHKLIDWDRVRTRLERYPEIARAFPEEVLKKDWEKPPYYCHGMAWRLGTWSDGSEGTFARLNQLLCLAGSIPNWENEESVLGMPDYGTFWSVIWQLQVAEHLCRIGTGVRWGEASGGPDLSVEIAAERWFVECYNVQKSYGLESFLEECLSKILDGHNLYPERNSFLPFSLPRGRRVASFLDWMLEPFCDRCYLDEARRSDVRLVYQEPGCVCVQLTDPNDYKPNPDNASGEPECHVRVMLEETIRYKKDKNQLGQHHPNILAVNLLLTDSQAANSLRPNIIHEMAPSVTDTHIDVLAVAPGVGIDGAVQDRFQVVSCRSEELRRRAEWMEASVPRQ